MKAPGNVEKLTWSSGGDCSELPLNLALSTHHESRISEYIETVSPLWKWNGCSSKHHNVKTCGNKTRQSKTWFRGTFNFECNFDFFPLSFFPLLDACAVVSVVCRTSCKSRWHTYIRLCLDYTFLELVNGAAHSSSVVTLLNLWSKSD